MTEHKHDDARGASISNAELDATKHDWPEDFAHENGRYQCECCQCGARFIGHKRRVECKECATAPNAQDQPGRTG